MRTPNKEQLDLCYRIIEQGIDCPEDREGNALFENDAREADRFIRKYRHLVDTPKRERIREEIL